MTRAVVLDAGALIALDRKDRAMLAVVSVIVRDKIPTYVPAGVVAQVWRGDARQDGIATLLTSDAIRIAPLDGQAAHRIGILLGRTGNSDVTDAHVALLAAKTGGVVYTSDPTDIAAIDPSLAIETV